MKNRLTALEENNKGIIEGKIFQKFLDSLSKKDREKFSGVPGGVMIFRGKEDDYNFIMKPYKGESIKVIIDDIEGKRNEK